MILFALVACGPSERMPDALEQQLTVWPDRFAEEVLDVVEPAGFDVRLDAFAIEALRAEPREWVDGVLMFEGQGYDARVRLKGHGSFEPIDAKPSFKIQPEGFFGIDTLVLNNCHSDPTFLHERMATVAFHQAGLPAARAGNAWVSVNGQSRGMYAVVEDVDPKMLHRWFADPNGTLYELFDGDFQPGLTEGFELEEGPDQAELIAHITDDLALGDVAGFDIASEHFDVDAFFRFWAVTVLVAQTDAFPYSQPGDDVYLYLDPQTEQFHFIPHGLDEAFFPRDRRIDQTNGMLARRCLASTPCREAFTQVLWDTVDDLEAAGFSEEVASMWSRSQNWRLDPRFVLPATPMPDGHPQEMQDWFAWRLPQVDEEL